MQVLLPFGDELDGRCRHPNYRSNLTPIEERLRQTTRHRPLFGDVALNLTVKLFGILSASVEINFMPLSEMSHTEHSCSEMPSPETHTLV